MKRSKIDASVFADVEDMWMDHHTMLIAGGREWSTGMKPNEMWSKPKSGKGIINLFKFKEKIIY